MTAENTFDKNKTTTSTPIGMSQVDDGLDQVLESAVEAPQQQANSSNSGVASVTEINAVINHIVAAKKMPVNQESFNKVLVSSCHLAQEGATSPKFAESKNVYLYGVNLKVGELRDACKKTGITVRKLARGLQNEIVKVAQKRNLEGNLSKSYKIENPNYNQQDLPWVSDFQTFNNNPAMPEAVRIWLLENYRNRFKPNSKINYRTSEVLDD